MVSLNLCSWTYLFTPTHTHTHIHTTTPPPSPPHTHTHTPKLKEDLIQDCLFPRATINTSVWMVAIDMAREAREKKKTFADLTWVAYKYYTLRSNINQQSDFLIACGWCGCGCGCGCVGGGGRGHRRSSPSWNEWLTIVWSISTSPPRGKLNPCNFITLHLFFWNETLPIFWYFKTTLDHITTNLTDMIATCYLSASVQLFVVQRVWYRDIYM